VHSCVGGRRSARSKAEDVVKVCWGMQVRSTIEIGCKRFLKRDCFLEIPENHVDLISKRPNNSTCEDWAWRNPCSTSAECLASSGCLYAHAEESLDVFV
jgi:hypothetical protein